MNPKTTFDEAVLRADHLMRLYDLLRDRRKRGVRKDWAAKFRQVMHWPANESFVRVDGGSRETILILRGSTGLDREHFTHDYLAELLRATVVAVVAAMDRYCHDVIVQNSWKLLSRPDQAVPKELQKLSLPLTGTKKALEKLRSSPKARPGTIVKAVIQEQLHSKHTFQNAAGVEKTARFLGIEDIWVKVAKEMGPSWTNSNVKAEVDTIARRRNQIVHEADVVLRTKSNKLVLRALSESDCRRWLEFMKSFIGGIDAVIKAAV